MIIEPYKSCETRAICFATFQCDESLLHCSMLAGPGLPAAKRAERELLEAEDKARHVCIHIFNTWKDTDVCKWAMCRISIVWDSTHDTDDNLMILEHGTRCHSDIILSLQEKARQLKRREKAREVSWPVRQTTLQWGVECQRLKSTSLYTYSWWCSYYNMLVLSGSFWEEPWRSKPIHGFNFHTTWRTVGFPEVAFKLLP